MTMKTAGLNTFAIQEASPIDRAWSFL